MNGPLQSWLKADVNPPFLEHLSFQADAIALKNAILRGPSQRFFQLNNAWLIPALRQMSAAGTLLVPLLQNERFLGVRKLRGVHRSPLLPAWE